MSDSPATVAPFRRRWQMGMPHLFLLMTCVAGGLAQVRELWLVAREMDAVLFGVALFVVVIVLPGIALALVGVRYGRPWAWGALGGGLAGAAYAWIVPQTRGFDPSVSIHVALALLAPAIGLLAGVCFRHEAANAALDIGWPATRERFGRRGAQLLTALVFVWLACLHLGAYSSVLAADNYRHTIPPSVWATLGPPIVALPILAGCGALWAALGRRWFTLRLAAVAGAIALGLALPPGDLALLFGVQALLVAAAVRLALRWRERDERPRLPVLLFTDVLPLLTGGVLLRVLAAGMDVHTIGAGELYPAVLYRLDRDELPRGAAMAGFYLAVLTLAAAWAVGSRGRIWLRAAALLAAVAWVGDALVALNHGAARMPRFGAAFHDVGWCWFQVALAIGSAIAAWLVLWRFATQRPDAVNDGGPRRGGVRRTLRLAAGCSAAAILVALAVPPASLYSRLVEWPIKTAGTSPRLAYEVDNSNPVVLADHATKMGTPGARSAPSYEEERATFLLEHRARLEIARAAANGGIVDFDDRLFPIGLVQLLMLAAEEAEARDDLNAALDDLLAALRFAHLSPRGDSLGGLGSKSSGILSAIPRLEALSERLTPPQKRAVLEALVELDAKVPDILGAERITLEPYVHAGAHDWRRRLDYVLIERTQPSYFDSARAVDALKLRQAVLRSLMCKLAVDRYYAERGQLPAELSDLVPDYLPELPQDPYRPSPFVYRTTKAGCTIYSVGPDEIDQGGGLTPLGSGGGDYGVTYEPTKQ